MKSHTTNSISHDSATLRVALVHDYIKEYGGAERVLEALHEMYPEAPVYTSVYLPTYLGPHRKRFETWNIKPSILQILPFKAKLISPIRIVAPFIFKLMDFSSYDVVIVSSTGAYIPNMIKKGSARHICYCHTPPRYLYGYKTAREPKNALIKAGILVMNHFLRMVDFTGAQKVDQFIANSEEVKKRIWKFYRKEAIVVYPPVEVRDMKYEERNMGKPHTSYYIPHSTYYLTGGRLARAKRIDLAVSACAKLGLPLKVFGKDFAGYERELQKLANQPPTTNHQPLIEFVGEVTDDEKYELMRNAKAFIFPSEQEDFGITPVEAMSCGIPVIAYRSGGVLETVVDKKTGVFFDDPTVESLSKAIKQLNNVTIDPNECKNQAKKFSKEHFVKNIKKVISS